MYIYDSKPGLARKPGKSVGVGGRGGGGGAVISAYASHFATAFKDKKSLIMPPTLKKLMGHIAFGACVGACVGGCVGHTFCTYCNF